MLSDLRLDHAGIAGILTSGPVAAAVHALAENVASGLSLPDDPVDGVVVDDYVTDRAASSVTIRDPRALLWHARDGVLGQAAGAAGLEVTDRPR